MSSVIEKRALQKIEELFRQIDQQTQDQPEPIDYPEALLFQLTALLGELELSDNEELQKCARLKDHIVPGMSRRHFLNLLVPIERALGREVKDSDFLVSSKDVRVAPTVQRRPLCFVLENIRSAFNVGSILRLADGLGCKYLVLVGYTPGLDSPAVQKTSLGAGEGIEILHFDRMDEAAEKLRGFGYQLVGLETAQKATPVFEYQFKPPTALVVGNERFGLDPKTLELCEALVVLPLMGVKNSLNVATALSAVAFEWVRQNPNELLTS